MAIELAAARVRALTPNELAERLDERFGLLGGAPRGIMERHQTLRRAIDWSYDLLTAAEQTAFNRASVFAGTFSLDGAETVLAAEPTDGNEVAALLSRLVDKSLVLAEERGGTTRYRLLETLRHSRRNVSRPPAKRRRCGADMHCITPTSAPSPGWGCGVLTNWAGPARSRLKSTICGPRLRGR